MTDLRHLSASQIAKLIRDKKVSSREAVDLHIAQIEAVNPAINAVVAERFDAARAEADAADEKVAKGSPGDLPPFHGVPCTIKECFAFEGMPLTGGLVARKDVVATDDATTVTRLKQAGAIPLGTTNTSELSMWMESVNNVYGRSKNPYDQTRIVGGSSGGEAAIVAAAGSPFGLGSDIGGSIRGPCFFNGVFGHKGSGGLVPSTGQYPMPDNDALRFNCVGPIARRAEDLMPLLRILAGPDGQDPKCTEIPLGDPSSVKLEGRRVISVGDNGRLAVSEDIQKAQARVVDALGDVGMVVEQRRFGPLKRQFEIWSARMAEEQEHSFGSMLKQGGKMRPGLELLKHAFGKSDHTTMAILLALTDPVPKLMPKLHRRMLDLCEALRAQVLDALGDDGVMIYPTYTTAAPRHTHPVRDAIRLKMPFAYQGIMNVLYLPATQVPLGLNDEGLPIGLQVVSKHGNDHVTIAVALELERIFGGWTPPELAGLPEA